MQYRRFGRLEWEASALGFGCMRLPTIGADREAPIDEAEAVRMIRRAIDAGVNYVDTAYPYHGGQSEIVVGKALRDGYREKVKLATKLPVWKVESPADFDRLLAEQLGKLATERVDFYLLHALSRERWREIVLKHGLLGRAAAALADGRIGRLGFSFHDDYDAFEEIVGGSDLWSFCQIQLNYMDTESQAGTRGLKLAAAKGLAVVAMEPLLGGKLVKPPKEIQEAMEGFPVRRSPVEWALDWLWDQPEIAVVLSGMSAMEQVEENLRIAAEARPGAFGDAERAFIADVERMYRTRSAISCSQCNYCMPCPTGVNIPWNFNFFNHVHLYDDLATARFRYQVFLKETQRAGACMACGACEELCPQAIPIREWMPKVAALLG